jgi:hypothetical protein
MEFEEVEVPGMWNVCPEKLLATIRANLRLEYVIIFLLFQGLTVKSFP